MVDIVHLDLKKILSLEERKLQGKSKNQNKHTTTNYKFLLVIDVMSRYLYATPLPKNVNKVTLKQAFEKLFKEGMPHFMILR